MKIIGTLIRRRTFSTCRKVPVGKLCIYERKMQSLITPIAEKNTDNLAILFSLWLKLSDDIMGLKQHIGGCTRQWSPWILHRQIVDKEFL